MENRWHMNLLGRSEIKTMQSNFVTSVPKSSTIGLMTSTFWETSCLLISPLLLTTAITPLVALVQRCVWPCHASTSFFTISARSIAMMTEPKKIVTQMAEGTVVKKETAGNKISKLVMKKVSPLQPKLWQACDQLDLSGLHVGHVPGGCTVQTCWDGWF